VPTLRLRCRGRILALALNDRPGSRQSILREDIVLHRLVLHAPEQLSFGHLAEFQLPRELVRH
jgi:hypothetical protein